MFTFTYYSYPSPNKTQKILRLSNRDRFLFSNLCHFCLTTRLVGELTQRYSKPFTSYEAIYRRLKQLREGHYINRRKMLCNGEYYYYLGSRGIALLEKKGVVIPPKATRPIGEALQRHEFEVTQFWIKFWWDCHRLGYPVKTFWRDGSIGFQEKYHRFTVYPDGCLVSQINGAVSLFLLELDRSTHRASAHRQSNRGFEIKMERYRAVWSQLTQAIDQVEQVRLLVVCRSEERMKSLQVVTQKITPCLPAYFTCWPRLILKQNSNATGWRYRQNNLIVDPVYTTPSRSPPVSLEL